MNVLSPEKVLESPAAELPILAVCEHFAGNEKFLLKALEKKGEFGQALDVTFDCEDGAEFGSSRKLVDMMLSILCSEAYREVSIGLRLPEPGRRDFRRELLKVMKTLRGRLSYLTVPKLRDAKALSRIGSLIQKLEVDARRREPLPLHILIEHPRALAEVRTIARMKRVRVLDFGIMDFVSSLGGALGAESFQSPAQFENPLLVKAKTDIVLAATERGVVPSHNISLELKDDSLVRAEARIARRRFGFRRMWSIHPIQIQPIVEEMSGDSAEVRLASEILLKAREANWAPIRHEDRLYDRASYRLFWWQLKQAKIFNQDLPAGSDILFGAPN